MKKPMGRDDERVRVNKAAPSHGTQTHKVESDRNKKQTADLKTKGKK
jgi:hypothetical protein